MSSMDQFYIAGMVGMVGALSVILFEHFKLEKRSRSMAQSLSRMDAQISGMKADLEEMRSSQRIKKRDKTRSKKVVHVLSQPHAVIPPHAPSQLHAPLKSQRPSQLHAASQLHAPSQAQVPSQARAPSQLRAPSQARARSVSVDVYHSAAEPDTSSGAEYYDVTTDDDDEDDSDAAVPKEPLQKTLREVDRSLQTGDVETIKKTQTVLDALCDKYPENKELWYQQARCCHRVAVRAVTPVTKREEITKGVSACWKALERDDSNADFHKLYAILVGLRCDFEPTKQRISDGNLFKQHIDIAIKLNPNDASLHHMLGRFKYEVAGLTWFERKMATALFGEPPSGSYEEALQCFMEAERLASSDWKENKMYMAKCYIGLGQVKKAVDCLKKAKNIYAGSELEERSLNVEIMSLLHKYS